MRPTPSGIRIAAAALAVLVCLPAAWPAAQGRDGDRSRAAVERRPDVAGAGQGANPTPPLRAITDAVGLHFNRSPENDRLRRDLADAGASLIDSALGAVDWNRDGHWDVLVTEVASHAVLFRNDGRGGFVREPLPFGDARLVPSQVLFVDLDGDGLEELVGSRVVYGEGRAWMGIHTRRGGEWVYLPRALEWDNPLGVRRREAQFLTAGDLNGDGRLDLAARGDPADRAGRPGASGRVGADDGADDLLFVNQGGLRFTAESGSPTLDPAVAGERFVEAARVPGLDADHDGRAAAPVDIDGDGDLDLALLTPRGLELLENTSPPRRFARVRLAAAGPDAQALGAEVALSAGGVTRRDIVKLTEGFRAQVPLDLHFGLAEAETIERLEVRWPSGAAGVWRDLPADRLLVVDERSGTVDARRLPRWSDGSRPTMMGSPSPSVVAQTLDGGRGPLAGGRPSVVNFWAPWCPPCNDELPALVDLAERYAGEIDFVGLSVELDDLDSVRESIERFGIGYPQFLMDEHLLTAFFGSEFELALPSTFAFDYDGRLRRVFRGAVTEAELDPLLASFRDEGTNEITRRLLAAAWIGQARVHRARGEPAAAHASYERVLQFDPDNRAARRGLAETR